MCLPHLKEDLTYFCPHFHEWMKVTSSCRHSQGIEVISLEGFRFPRTTVHSYKEKAYHQDSILNRWKHVYALAMEFKGQLNHSYGIQRSSSSYGVQRSTEF